MEAMRNASSWVADESDSSRIAILCGVATSDDVHVGMTGKDRPMLLKKSLTVFLMRLSGVSAPLTDVRERFVGNGSAYDRPISMGWAGRYRSQNDRQLSWFSKMMIEAGPERFGPFRGRAQCSHRQQQWPGDGIHAPDFSRHRVTVHTGHLDIQHHHIRTPGAIRSERTWTVCGRLDGVTVSLEEKHVGLDQIRVVVCDE